ncbi:hypothetical protein IFM89_001858 [Coptis chinensis]|uniref:Uncharacterized protein n=1 Tax=Coptis chinensis TaxID=261450 RepID=A0A835HKC3_9MAGN|nr:hypothetical protein IFM89_001858 [Coptis chinensis]
MAAGIVGWYGPLIDLSKAASHIGHYVQLLVFVHRTRPIQKYKTSKEGVLLRTDVQVGDDTRTYFSVCIWQKEMGSMIVSGDVILLQNVKIVKFGDVVEAGTVQDSSLVPLVHPYALLVSKGAEDLISCSGVGKTTKEKLKKVINWVQQTKGALSFVQEPHVRYSSYPVDNWISIVTVYFNCVKSMRQLMTNWKVDKERNIHNCSSISELSCLNISCKAAFSAFVSEIFLPFTGGSDKEFDEGKMFIRRRLFATKDNKLVEDLICLGCKQCNYPMNSDYGSLLEQNRFPMYCQKSTNRLHNICSIYRPFLLYVWDQSDYVPLLITNKGAELLFGNITAERVYLCYKEERKGLNSIKYDEHVKGKGHCGQMAFGNTRCFKGEAVGSKPLDGNLQTINTQVDRTKRLNFYRIWKLHSTPPTGLPSIIL